MVFQDLDGKEAAPAVEASDPYSHLPTIDRALMGLVEKLGYSMHDASQMLGLDTAVAFRKYWRIRRQLKPRTNLRDALKRRSPELLARDLCALEMVEVLGFSIGRAAKALSINKGHLCRRIAITRKIIQQAGDPREDE